MDAENGNGRELMNLDRATQLLREATTFEQILQVRDHAVAWREFAETVARSLQLQNEAAEIRLRAERKAGLYLRELHLRGGNRRSNSLRERLNLKKLEIDRNESSRWQKLADILVGVFEEYFREFGSSQHEITRASLMRFARLHKGTSPHGLCGNNGNDEVTGLSLGLLQLTASHKTFSCICIYPPWPKVRQVGRDPESREFRSQLERLPVGKLAAGNAHVHLATTSERLEDAIHVLHAWRVPFRSILVCARRPVEHGPYWLTAQEFLLLGTKGNNGFRCRTLHSIVELDRSHLGVTPQAVRELIEQVSDGPFLEVFGMTPCPGWTVVATNGVYEEVGGS